MGTSASFNNPSFSVIPQMGPMGASQELPTPDQIAPDVMAAANNAACCPPTVPECATTPMLHTHPIALADPMAAIPTPQQIAPHVFFNYPANNNAQFAQQPRQMQQPYPPQQLQPPVQQQPPQQQPPQQPQQPQPKAPQPPPQQPPQQPQQQQGQVKGPFDEFDGALSDEVVKNLNRQLNDPDEVTRATAATDLYNILQKHPKIADAQGYKPYVDAFMEKIMSDPSSLVRGVGEMTMQLGLIKNPSDPVKNHLKSLSKKDDTNLTKENDQASSILTGLENGTLGTGFTNTTKKDANNPANPADAQSKGAGQTGAGQNPNQAANGQAQPGGQPADANASANSHVPGVAGGAPPTPSLPTTDPTANNASTQGAAQNQAQTPPQNPQQDPTQAVAQAGAQPPQQPQQLAAQPADPQAGQPMGQAPAQPTALPDPTAQAAQSAYPQAGAQVGADPSVYGAAFGTNAMNGANGMSGMPGVGYPSPMQNYAPQMQSPYAPNSMATGPGFGNRLNLMSASPNSYLPSWFQPQTGQRLNMYEGMAR